MEGREAGFLQASAGFIRSPLLIEAIEARNPRQRHCLRRFCHTIPDRLGSDVEPRPLA